MLQIQQKFHIALWPGDWRHCQSEDLKLLRLGKYKDFFEHAAVDGRVLDDTFAAGGFFAASLKLWLDQNHGPPLLAGILAAGIPVADDRQQDLQRYKGSIHGDEIDRFGVIPKERRDAISLLDQLRG